VKQAVKLQVPNDAALKM